MAAHLDDEEGREEVAVCGGGEHDAAGGRVHAGVPQHAAAAPLRHLAPVQAQLVHRADLPQGNITICTCK